MDNQTYISDSLKPLRVAKSEFQRELKRNIRKKLLDFKYVK